MNLQDLDDCARDFLGASLLTPLLLIGLPALAIYIAVKMQAPEPDTQEAVHTEMEELSDGS